jgi:hypothetical protein
MWREVAERMFVGVGRVWEDPSRRVFGEEELGGEAVEELRTRGMLLVRLGGRARAAVESMYDAMELFFAGEAGDKARCTHAGFPYIGYRHNPDYAKEMFMVRDHSLTSLPHISERATDDGCPISSPCP